MPALQLVTREYNNRVIHQREPDGYFDATAMCKAAGKLFGHYRQNASTEDFCRELSSSIGIPIDDKNQGLIQSSPGAPENGGGTWIHPRVAMHLAQWASPEFAVVVPGWVWDIVSGSAPVGSAVSVSTEQLIAAVRAGVQEVVSPLSVRLVTSAQSASTSTRP